MQRILRDKTKFLRGQLNEIISIFGQTPRAARRWHKYEGLNLCVRKRTNWNGDKVIDLKPLSYKLKNY